jgi:hypothetical protein
MSEHTPGPWTLLIHVEGDPVLNVIRDGTEKYRGSITSAKWIAELDADSLDGECGENEANARLIAAAPDLLAACEAVLSNLDHLSDVWGQEGVTRTVQDRLRAAIAKAKGGES